MNRIKQFEQFTSAYKAPKFAKRPAAGDTGYAMMAKYYGATPGPKKKRKGQKTQEVMDESLLLENKVFTSTIYRMPTDDELSKFEEYPEMTANNIFSELSYTLIGRGVLDNENKMQIVNSLERLCELYPDSERYKEALAMANEMKPRFTRVKEDGGDASLYMGELPGMGDSAGFPQEPAGMGQPHNSTLPAEYTEDPDDAKKKRMNKRMKNLRGFVDFIGGDPE